MAAGEGRRVAEGGGGGVSVSAGLVLRGREEWGELGRGRRRGDYGGVR